MGFAVTAMDVSATALEIGRELFRRLPVVGHHMPPEFLVFDGRRFDLPDASMDRIVCLNAFHHVPNPADVLKEMARVLRPGGIAGFSEPGAGHSRTALAQYEMRNYTVIENDIVIEDIERWAIEGGFNRLELAVVDPRSYRVDWREYTDLIAGGVAAERYVDTVREAAVNRRLFFLHKAGETPADSRQRRGLAGSVRVVLDATRVSSGGVFRGEATVENTGANVWLPSEAPLGPVFVGVHLFARDGQLINRDFGRIRLPRGLRPGESATFRFTVDAPTRGDYRLGFDLVSEHVCWFEMNGASVVLADVSVS
jgi:SAM-dependent methyltransferase